MALRSDPFDGAAPSNQTDAVDKVSMIVGEAKYNAGDPVVMTSQVNQLKATGADTFLVIATPGYAASAVSNAFTSGWKPKIIMNQVAASTTTWRGVTKN